MRRPSILVLCLVVLAGTGSTALAAPPGPHDRAAEDPASTRRLGSTRGLHRPQASRAGGRRRTRRWCRGRAATGRRSCAARCVPLDRADPDGPTIGIAFQILPAADQANARPDPIFIAEGGPGQSTTGSRDFFAFALDSLNDTRDLVLIDQRGTGLSGALRCGDLQDGWNSVDELLRAIRRCGQKLGPDADRYGTGDIALDIEAVRRALGYNRINYFGGSYGTVVAQAYASRNPGHVRAMVLDAGLHVNVPPHAASYGFDVPGAFVEAVAVSCARAPSCAAQHPDPVALLHELVARIAADPVTGRARDEFGKPRRITVDEVGLAFILGGGGLNQAELPAAAAALLHHGDTAPLLRLGAESIDWPGHSGPPRFFSAGANWATWCTDDDLGLDRFASSAERRAQFEAVWASLPDDRFAPFSKEAWRDYWWPESCTAWPTPDRWIRPVLAGPIDVPVLVIEGDLDTVVPPRTTDRMAARFVDPTIVRLQGGGHINVGWSECARSLTDRYIRLRRVGDASCADEPQPVFPSVDRFARTSEAALEASSRPGDESTARDRRAAWAAVRTILDAWFRSFRTPVATADGAGLRGGSFSYDFSGPDGAVMVLRDSRFVQDIAVRGTSSFSFDFDDPRLIARVSVHGRGTADGMLRISSAYWFETRFGRFRIKGTFGRRDVVLSMPGN